MKHLSEKTRKFTESATYEQRIKHVKEFRWIGYSDSIKILKKMDDLMDYPKSSRMPNLLLVGDSNNGKTARAYRLHLVQKMVRSEHLNILSIVRQTQANRLITLPM